MNMKYHKLNFQSFKSIFFLYLCKKLKDSVKRGEVLFVIYAGSKKRLNYAIDLVKERNPYSVK